MQESDKDQFLIHSTDGMLFAGFKGQECVWAKLKFDAVRAGEKAVSLEDDEIDR